ncbi:MAG: nitrous oxide reductase family maturation protein NosD [Candidatus Omnitrophota bacterium]
MKNSFNIFAAMLYLCLLSYGLALPGYAADASKLEVEGDIETPGLRLTPFPLFDGTSSPPVSDTANQARIYYNKDDEAYLSENNAYWDTAAPPKNIATIIVAAYDSLGSLDSSGAACSPGEASCRNLKAEKWQSSAIDYTCNGQNDQETINRAITDLPSSGGAVYLLEGTYNITKKIDINKDNVSLIGAGRGTVLKVGADNISVLFASGKNRLTISRLSIDATGRNTPLIVDMRGITYSKLTKLWINGGYFGISLASGSNYNIIKDNQIQGTKYYQIFLSGSSNNNIISANNLQGSTNFGGIYIDSSTNNIIRGNISSGHKKEGIWIDKANNNIVLDNIVANNKLMGIEISSGSNNILRGNRISGNTLQGVWITGGKRNLVWANSITSNKQEGVYIEKSSSNSLGGNIISDNGEGNNYSGIRVSGGAAADPADNNLIAANRIYDSRGSGYGINIDNVNCNGSYLASNYIDGPGYIDTNASTPYDRRIRDKGQGTQYTGKEKLTLEQWGLTVTVSGDGLIKTSAGRPIETSYLRIKGATGSVNASGIAPGKSSGDILILQGTNDSYKVTIPKDGANVKLNKDDDRALGRGDTLELIYNGTNWLEVNFSDN